MDKRELFCNLPTLETKRIILRKFVESDVNDVFEYAQNQNVANFTSWNVHNNIDDSKQFVNVMLDGYNKGEPQSYGVVVKETGKLIGSAGFMGWNVDANRIEFGYVLAENYWGRGIATEIVIKLIEFSFSVLRFNKIGACCDANNLASEKVMIKSGMKFEGLFKQHLTKSNKLLDIKFYGLLFSEWSMLNS